MTNTETRRCIECGDVFEADEWWMSHFPDFCSEDCEHYHRHPED